MNDMFGISYHALSGLYFAASLLSSGLHPLLRYTAPLGLSPAAHIPAMKGHYVLKQKL